MHVLLGLYNTNKNQMHVLLGLYNTNKNQVHVPILTIWLQRVMQQVKNKSKAILKANVNKNQLTKSTECAFLNKY